MEKRSQAQRSCRRLSCSSDMLSAPLAAFEPFFGHREEAYQCPRTGVEPHPLRAGIDPQISWSGRVVVRGQIKRSKRSSFLFALFTGKASSNESGKEDSSMGTRRKPRAVFQKGVRTKVSRHHKRQRQIVRVLTPINSRSYAIRVGVGPFRQNNLLRSLDMRL